LAIEPIQAAVLTGGMSRRMGRDKATMSFGNMTALGLVLQAVQAVTDDVLIVGDRPAYHRFDVPVYADLVPGQGPLGGILTALAYSRHTHTLLVACDMPLVSSGLLQAMAAVERTYDVLVPVHSDGRFEPLCAVYSDECLHAAENLIAAGALRVDGLFEQVTVHQLDETWLRRFDQSLESFTNMNTPEDAEYIAERIRAR
jgi:molybdenum cofactor guanylyltransferase